jgi:hypothetical protein
MPSGVFTASDQEVADHLLETHFPGCQPIMENIPARTPIEEDWLVASEAVDSDTIRWAIESCGCFKSTGEDGIFPALLKMELKFYLDHRLKSSRLVLL